MSVFNYLGPAIYHAYPSLRDLSRVKGDCSSSVMDSEPGRCRRTDGRKWRCSKNVVPFQKYCERHMHRGRQGSRKHVEARPDNRAWDNSRMPVMSLVASDHDTDSRVSVSIQSDLGPSQPRSSYTTGFPTVLKCRNDETRDASLRANCSMSGGDHADGKYSFDGKPMKLSSRKHNAVGNNYMGFNSPRHGLSPKSVLNAAGKVGLGLGCTATMEAGSQRCRRTDGKKWQCRRDALHNQKYCDAHMHRGAKRIVVRPEYSRRFQAAPTTITGNLDSGINLNMVPASPQHGGPSNNSSSSPSDATTITDENISFCLTNSLHHG